MVVWLAWIGAAVLLIGANVRVRPGVIVVLAFAAGFHLCYRLARGRWMPPEH